MMARDLQVEPVNTAVERYLSDQKIPWKLYTGSELYRIHASHHVIIKGMITLKTKATFERILQSAWIAGMQSMTGRFIYF